MNDLASDLRYAARMLRKNPGFTVVAVLALALGIGANTAIFSVVNAVLLRPLAFRAPDRLVSIVEWQSDKAKPMPANPLNFLDWRDQTRSFDGMAAYHQLPANVAGTEEPQQLTALRVTADFFPMLGVQPALGRYVRPDEDRPGGDKPVVLSYALWVNQFGADRAVIGRRLSINDVTYHVVGVMPRDFGIPAEHADLWIPMELNREESRHDGRYLSVIARLKPGMDIGQADSELRLIASRLSRLRPDLNAEASTRMEPLTQAITGKTRLPLLVLLAAVGFVLLIACANVANLLLMRAAVRRGEIAVRFALGASRSRIARQLLTESLLLSCTAGAFGLLLAYWGVAGLIVLLPADFPLTSATAIRIDPGVLAFTLGLSIVTGILFGTVPALQATREDMRTRTSTSALRWTRSALVVAEVAVAAVLLIGAGLLTRSFLRMMQVDPGFQPDHILTMRMFVSPERHEWGEKVGIFTEQVLARIRAVPEVKSAGSIHFLPLDGRNSGSIYTRLDRPQPPAGHEPDARFSVVTPGFFDAMRVPLIQGRMFNSADRFGGPGAIVISETLARSAFPNENPLGKRLGLWWTWVEQATVVGVVGDLRQDAINAPTQPTIYLSNVQAPNLQVSLVIRTSADPTTAARDIVNAIHQVDKDQPVADIASMDQVISKSVARPRFQSTLTAIFGGLALILSCVGIFAVISYSVMQRDRELAIRMALGARPAELSRYVVSEGMILAGTGVLLGLAAAMAATRVLKSLLFGVTPQDPVTFASVAVLLLTISLFACWSPAHRASSTDPMKALRHE